MGAVNLPWAPARGPLELYEGGAPYGQAPCTAHMTGSKTVSRMTTLDGGQSITDDHPRDGAGT